jgi:hypothetical protein
LAAAFAAGALVAAIWSAREPAPAPPGLPGRNTAPDGLVHFGRRGAPIRQNDPAPVEALALLQPARNDAPSAQRLQSDVTDWILRAPFEAWEWIAETGEREIFVLPALRALAVQDPTTALGFALSWKATDSVEAFYAARVVIETALPAGDFYDAASLVELVPNSDLRLQLAREIAAPWAAVQPVQALGWADTFSFDDRPEITRTIVTSWAARDVAAAAAFAEALPTGAVRTAALSAVLAEWSQQDLSTAGDWLVRHRGEFGLAATVTSIATQPALVAAHPFTALQWAETIPDPRDRTDAVLEILRQWSRRDPPAAYHYLAASPLFAPDQLTSLRALLVSAMPVAGPP